MLAMALALSCGGGSEGPLVPIDAGPADAASPAAARPPVAVAAPPNVEERLGPPYPIVLAHGFFGFDDFAGAGFFNYFHGVRDHLAEQGEPLVFTPTVDPFNDSTERGAMLAERIEAILAETGHAKVNIVGHSQGGLDARVVASTRPELVASVTTIATPHQGSEIADVVLRLVPDDRFRELVDALVRLIGAAIYDDVGDETSVVAGLRQFSRPGIAEFNARYTNVVGVDYHSIAGRTDLHGGGADCRVGDAPAFVARWDRYRDPVDPLLALPEAIVDGGLASEAPNDGLVRVRDAKHGRFLGCVPADHLDEVGQLLGDRPGFGNEFDHLAFYAELVAWLREQGH